MNHFHKYECANMAEIIQTTSVHMALRIFYHGFSLFDQNIKYFYEFLNETLKCPTTIFDSNDSKDDEKSKFGSLISLSRSEKKFNLEKHLNFLRQHEDLKALTNHFDKVEKILEIICQISDHNFHGFFSGNFQSGNENTQSDLQIPVGCSSLLLTSLINHSCSPNILRICVNGKVALVVCKVIQKDEQIFDCYK